jgi:hypothetical protein
VPTPPEVDPEPLPDPEEAFVLRPPEVVPVVVGLLLEQPNASRTQPKTKGRMSIGTRSSRG